MTSYYRLLLSFILSSCMLSHAYANQGNNKKTIIPGYVVHGINNYNGNIIVDYSLVSPTIPYLNTFPPVDEIGVFQEGSELSGTILPETDRNLPVATTRSFFDFFNPNGYIDTDTVNIPLGKVGINFLSPEFTDLSKRIVPVPFAEAEASPNIYRKKGIIASPTVKQWEKISGKMTIIPKKKNRSNIKITIRNAFPNAVYTLWDLGTTKPLSVDESGYAVPLGGIPNILLTDKNGCGFANIKLSYDLSKQCKTGAEYCSNYVSAFYNWDYQAYGASAAATWAKAPTGIYGGNQMIWPTSGEVLIEPQTDFKPKKHGCPAT